MDWRISAANVLVSIAHSQNMLVFRENELRLLVEQLAARERSILESRRVGFAYIQDTYSPSGMTRFLGQVRKVWTVPVIQSPAPPESAHQLQCVLSVHLDKDTYDQSQLQATFQDYFVKSLPGLFECAVADVQRVQAGWYDLLINYSTGLVQIYELVLQPAWVLDAVTKPAQDFGKYTIAMVR